MKLSHCLILASSGLLFVSCVKNKKQQASTGSDIFVWNPTAQWTPELETEFQKFVQRIGDARWAHNLKNRPADLAEWKKLIGYDPGSCVFLKDCIKNPAVNPLYSEADNALNIEADCGDVPGIMRAYFSHKKKLPFIYTWSTESPPGDKGIFPPTRIFNQSMLTSMNSLFTSIRDHQHAHFYRTPVNVEHTDTYPVRISRDTVKPGTVVYDVRGHVMMVFRIRPNGTPLVIQGHPGEPSGNPPSYFTVVDINPATLPLDGYYKSGGFRNWRPYVTGTRTTYAQSGKYPNGANLPSVTYAGGENIIFAPNSALPNLDVDGTNNQLSYSLPGKGAVDRHTYIRAQLCDPSICGVRKPSDLREMLFGICTKIQERQERVVNAQKAGLDAISHPALPSDVYSTQGPWESHSTPGFDARFRKMFTEAIAFARETSSIAGTGATGFEYAGTKADLIKLYRSYLAEVEASGDCSVKGTGEAGAYSLTFKDINKSLFNLSFDPYHCSELRWGIQGRCTAEHSKFYNEEVRIRNVSGDDRPEDAGFDANGLPKQFGNGPASSLASAAFDIEAALNSISADPSGPITTQPNVPAPVQPPQVQPTNPTTPPVATPTFAAVWCRVNSGDNVANVRKTPNGDLYMTLASQASIKAVAESGDGKWYSVEYRLNGVDHGAQFDRPAWIFKSLLDCN